MLESLKWIGLDWDEGPDIDGPHKPYVQSERLDLYHEVAEALIDSGYAYRQESVVRFRMPKEGQTVIQDMIFDHLKFENQLYDDFIILKSDGIISLICWITTMYEKLTRMKPECMT